MEEKGQNKPWKEGFRLKRQDPVKSVKKRKEGPSIGSTYQKGKGGWGKTGPKKKDRGWKMATRTQT